MDTPSEKTTQIDALLTRGVLVEVLPNTDALRARLLEGTPMKIYLGADPTSGALHLSHAKNYMLLEEFRKLGHQVFVLIGDFTARIGDPTDKTTARQQLSKEEVTAHVTGWLKQIAPLMDFTDTQNPPQIVYNNDWLSALTMEDVVHLASQVTVQHMLERDMFEKRMQEGKPIHLHEFMYPLMQGYDSVMLDVDMELCGTDQIFNALVGRTLLRKLKGKEKLVAAVNLMEDPETGALMSKSRGTGIFLDASPFDMYGGIMAQPDSMIRVFLINNTRIPLTEIDHILETLSPRDAKMRTALEITTIFHGKEAAEAAQDKFVTIFQKREVAEDIEEVQVPVATLSVFDLARTCLDDTVSNSEIRRLIEQKSIKIDAVVAETATDMVTILPEGSICKIGKRKWFKIHVKR
jgi:tyrosyl-tRNA synthetase